ncbi:MAG: putative hydrolase YxeP [Acidobacteria bacterium ADurb.Bin051]|jgi:amidohydrolase|nr:MAG: putative hydrolase YxeP [Acidobacteria bacterium ADurb.Bin051]
MRRATLAIPALAAILAAWASPPAARALSPSPLAAELDRRVEAAGERLISWRRHLHAHPELSNREVETAKFVAARLAEMGLPVRTGIAGHGVVAVIEGGRSGPTIALRADLDALPVAEPPGLPFASQATGVWEGQSVPVMHACGHDAHTAMLLAAAEVLAGVRAQLPGRIVLLFQPAEEGVPAAERPAGAEAMIAAGVLDQPPVEAIFGFHVMAPMLAGTVGYRAGALMAAADSFEIRVHGRGAHGSTPWTGIDPIVVGSEIVTALQSIVARETDLTSEPAVVTVGQFQAGTRHNIIPDSALLVGTIRTFDAAMQADIHARLRRRAEGIAAGHGATVEVTIEPQVPVTINDPDLAAMLLPTLQRVLPGRVVEARRTTAAEDFSHYGRRVPALFLFLGVTPAGELATAAGLHSPRFTIDESALPTGVRVFVHLAADYLFAAAR